MSELLYTAAVEVDFKAITDEGTFTGYAAVFNNVDLQGDVIERGAFSETLKKSAGNVPIFMAHDSGRIVGFGREAVEDDKGLRVVGEFTPDSDEGRNAAATARHAQRRGHKLGLSIGYRVRKDGATYNEQSGVRTLRALDLYEYSIAGVPANPRARISGVKSVRDVEQALRGLGLTGDQAREWISVIKSGAGREALDLLTLERDAKEAAAGEFMAAMRGVEIYVKGKEIIYGRQ